MIRSCILILQVFLLSTSLVVAQKNQTFYVHARALEPKEYDKSKVVKPLYIRFNQSETFKMLGDSIEPITLEGQKYLYKIVYRNGKEEFFDTMETTIKGYYPQLGFLFLGDYNVNYVKSIETGEYLSYRGDPLLDVFSPSGRYLLVCIFDDEMNYFLHEKVDGKYIPKGFLFFHRSSVKGIYWESDDELRFLGQKGESWIPYSGKIKTQKLE